MAKMREQTAMTIVLTVAMVVLFIWVLIWWLFVTSR